LNFDGFILDCLTAVDSTTTLSLEEVASRYGVSRDTVLITAMENADE